MKLKVSLMMILVCLLLATTAHATLTTIGTATYMGNDYNLIWDNDNNEQSVIWLDYVEYDTWENISTWVSSLNSVLTYNIDSEYTVDFSFNSWRLPDATNASLWQANTTDTELGHLYHDELGLESGIFISDSDLNATNFDNLSVGFYWTAETQNIGGTDYAYIFVMREEGYYSRSYQGYSQDGLAVITAEVSTVPVPGTICLLASGLLGLVGLRRKRK